FVYVEYPSSSEASGKRKAFAEKKYFTLSTPVNLDGNLEEYSGGAGTVSVTGWAYNAANTSQKVDVHFYLGDENGADGSLALGAVTAENDRGDGTSTGYNETFQTSATGTYYVWVAIIDPSGENNHKWSRSENPVNITSDSNPEPEFIPGDANGDGEVTLRDVAAVRKFIMGEKEIDEKAADLNGDGEVNLRDVRVIRKIILGESAA
ncbi:MAG: dockerin type I repeat-containing protein, partial [Oscillospiraceae bacterium]|nr:dockerin type I repeat-containing protein [Oscillospiraceae bacterium]